MDDTPNPVAGREPTTTGTYAIYHTPKGGLHLVYRTAGTEEDQHLDIPPMIVNMAQRAAAGKGLGPLGHLLPKGTKP